MELFNMKIRLSSDTSSKNISEINVKSTNTTIIIFKIVLENMGLDPDKYLNLKGEYPVFTLPEENAKDNYEFLKRFYKEVSEIKRNMSV